MATDDEIRAFLRTHEQPTSEPGTPAEWASRMLSGRDADPDSPPLETVEEEMRKHDETEGR